MSNELGELQLKVDAAKEELKILEKAKEEIKKKFADEARNTHTWLVISTVASIVAVLLLIVVCTSVGLGLKKQVDKVKTIASNAADTATATATYFGVGSFATLAAAIGYSALM